MIGLGFYKAAVWTVTSKRKQGLIAGHRAAKGDQICISGGCLNNSLDLNHQDLARICKISF